MGLTMSLTARSNVAGKIVRNAKGVQGVIVRGGVKILSAGPNTAAGFINAHVEVWKIDSGVFKAPVYLVRMNSCGWPAVVYLSLTLHGLQ